MSKDYVCLYYIHCSQNNGRYWFHLAENELGAQINVDMDLRVDAYICFSKGANSFGINRVLSNGGSVFKD